jgi:hypothetical protein
MQFYIFRVSFWAISELYIQEDFTDKKHSESIIFVLWKWNPIPYLCVSRLQFQLNTNYYRSEPTAQMEGC